MKTKLLLLLTLSLALAFSGTEAQQKKSRSTRAATAAARVEQLPPGAPTDTPQIPIVRTGPITFAWDANPPDQQVEGYRLSKGGEVLGAATGTTLTVEAGFPVGLVTIELVATRGNEASPPATFTFQVVSSLTAPANLRISSTGG